MLGCYGSHGLVIALASIVPEVVGALFEMGDGEDCILSKICGVSIAATILVEYRIWRNW